MNVSQLPDGIINEGIKVPEDFLENQDVRTEFIERHFREDSPHQLKKILLRVFEQIINLCLENKRPEVIQEVLNVLPTDYIKDYYRLKFLKAQLENNNSEDVQVGWYLSRQVQLLEERVKPYLIPSDIEWEIAVELEPKFPKPDDIRQLDSIPSASVSSNLPVVINPQKSVIGTWEKNEKILACLNELAEVLLSYELTSPGNVGGFIAIAEVLERISLVKDPSVELIESNLMTLMYGQAQQTINILESLENRFDPSNSNFEKGREIAEFVVTSIRRVLHSLGAASKLLSVDKLVEKHIFTIQERVLQFYQIAVGKLIERMHTINDHTDYYEKLNSLYGIGLITSHIKLLEEAFDKQILGVFGLKRNLEALLYGSGAAKYAMENPDSKMAIELNKVLLGNDSPLRNFTLELIRSEKIEDFTAEAA